MNQYLRIFLILSSISCLTACHTLEDINTGAQENPPAVKRGPIQNNQPAIESTTNMTSQENSTPNEPPAAAPTAVTNTPPTPTTQSSNVIPVISQPGTNKPDTSTDSSEGSNNNDSEVRSTPNPE